MKKKIASLCILSLLSVILLAGCGNKEKKNNPNYNSDNYLSGTHYALMNVEEYGEIYLELNADAAPATVTNFINLVNDGFYNGLTFHRVIDGFMIQGGDPEGTGLGGSTYTLPGEFAANGFKNAISHVRGTISMARAEDYNSASSQFFIVHEDATALDGYYAGFGKVVYGMDLVDDICFDTIVEDENGTVLSENQPVITSITMVDEAAVPVEEEKPTFVEKEEQPLPEPVSKIEIFTISNPEDVEVKDRWVINEEADIYVLRPDTDLLSLALYQVDLSQEVIYGTENMLAYSSDVSAGAYISLQINISREEVPNQLLIGEEHNGALRMYLLSYDENNHEAYLVPFMN